MSKSISIRKMSVTAIVMLTLLALPLGRMVFAPPADSADPREIRRLVDKAAYGLKKGRFRDALLNAEQALELDKDSISAWQIQAEVCAVWNPEYNKETLEECLKALADKKAQKPEVVVFMEQINSGQADKTIETIRKIIEAEPENERRSLYHYILSRAYAKKGNGEKTASELMDAIGWNSDFYQAYCDLSNIYVQVGEMELAFRTCRYLLDHDPKNPEWYLLMAAVMARSNKTADARNIAGKMVESLADAGSGRDIGLAYYILATANYMDYKKLPGKEKLNNYLKGAREELDKARQKERGVDERLKALEASLRKAALYIVDRKLIGDVREKILDARSEKDAEKKAAIVDEAIEPMEKLFDDILAQKEALLEEVKKNIKNAAEADKLLAEPHLLLAGYYANEGELEKAAEQYGKYLVLREEAQNSLYSLGLIQTLLGKTEDARNTFAKIKDEEGKKHELAYIGEGLLAGLRGDAGAAGKEYEALIELREKNNRDDWAMLEMLLAHTYYALNKPDAAKPHLEKGVDAMGGLIMAEDTDYAALLGTTDPKALGALNFALVLSVIGMTDQAQGQCDKFLEIAPDSVVGRFLRFILLAQKPEHYKEAEGMIGGLKKAFDAKDKKNVTPCLAAALLYQGIAATESDKDKRAKLEALTLEQYEEMIKKNDKFGDAYAILAKMYLQRGETHKAVEIAEEGLKKDVGSMSLLSVLIELMVYEGEATVKDFINVYKEYNDKVASSPREDIDRQAGMLALAKYYRQLGRVKEMKSEYENLVESIEDEKEPEKKRKQYLAAFVALRGLSLAENDVKEAKRYNDEIKKIDPEFPGADHFEGLCCLIEGKEDKAKAAFEREIALGKLNLTNAMSRVGLNLIVLKTAADNRQISAVLLNLDDAQELMDKIQDRNVLLGTSSDKVVTAEGYISFIKVCAFLARGKSRDTRRAANILNKTSVLFPGAEGLGATETTAFKGINLKAVISGWKTDNNFYDLAAGAYYLSQGLYSEALKYLDAEIAVNKDNFIALLFVARAESSLGNEQEAIDHLIECQKKQDGKFIPAYGTLFGIYMRRDVKPYEKITELLEKMCALDPMFRFDKARYFEQVYNPPKDSGINKYQLALKEYDILCNAEDLPNRWNALNSAAWMRSEYFADNKKELEKAETQILEAIELYKKIKSVTQPAQYMRTMATIQDTYGWVLYKQGLIADDKAKLEKYEEASKVFEECIASLNINRTDTTIPVVLYHQALVYNNLSEMLDGEKADDYRDKAINVLRGAMTYPRFEERTKVKELLDKLEGQD